MYKACERFKILPPKTQACWDECDVWTRAMLIAYNQICEVEEQEREIAQTKAMMGRQ